MSLINYCKLININKMMIEIGKKKRFYHDNIINKKKKQYNNKNICNNSNSFNNIKINNKKKNQTIN